MSNKSLLPKETIEFLADHRVGQYSSPSKIIYISTICLIFASLALLPSLSIDISVTSPGLLRPAVDISAIKIPSSGKISQVFVSINQQVMKGQKILTLDSAIVEQKISFISDEVTEDKLMVEDLNLLISGDHRLATITTPLYKQAFQRYSQSKQDLTIKHKKAKMDYNRNLKLHMEKVIADAEFENFQFELDRAKNELELLKQNQLSQWQSELSSYEKEIEENEAQLTQLKEEKNNLIIRAPMNGTIQSLTSIQKESQVFANQDIAQISPDTSSIVEAFVNPNDIGLLQKDMSVLFQVDAFNYNQWGLATGKVMDISNDIHIINEKPIFKVRCVLDKEYLQLKNGYKGYLKKGMTLQARFKVTERTLWQLLFDKVDDWLNPNTYQGANQS